MCAPGALAAWRLALLAETAVLLISELITKAVLHARGSTATLACGLKPPRPGCGLRFMTPTRAATAAHAHWAGRCTQSHSVS